MSMIDKNHYLALDGLRGVAALAVVIFHRRWYAPAPLLEHAYLAVDFFFALSGFVICHAYEKRLLSRALSLREFVRVRAIRLGPMLLIGGLLASALLLLQALRSPREGPPLDLAAALAMLASMVALPAPIPLVTAPNEAFPLNSPTWSLFFEILANAAFALCLPRLSNRVLMAVVTVCFGWLATAALMDGGLGRQGSYYATLLGGIPRTGFSFLVGVLIYRAHQGEHPSRLLRLRGSFAVLCVALIALLAVPGATERSQLFDLLCIALLFPLIISMAAHCRLSGRSAWLATVSGALSYPLYILHMPLYHWLETLVRPGGLKWLTAAVVAILAISYAVLKLVDEPVRRALAARRNRQRLRPA